jgi:putative membrane protein
MRNFRPVLFLPILAIAIVSCGDNKKSNNYNAKTQVDAEGLGFIKLANESGLTEIKASSLAESISKNPRVVNFAKMMVADHSKAAQELNKLAQDKMVIKSDTLTVEHQQKMDSLKKLTGGNFDKAYMDMMLKDHIKAVELFDKASGDRIPAVQDFAKKTLPALKMHLDSAKSINSSLK